jgi:starch phosphorylase
MADPLWEALDSYLWQTTQNPWVILQTVSTDKVNALLATPDFQERLSPLCCSTNTNSFRRMHGFRRRIPEQRS